MSRVVATMPILTTDNNCSGCRCTLWTKAELKVEESECKTLIAECGCKSVFMRVIAHKSYFENER